jgi:phosphohistidine phosphatase
MKTLLLLRHANAEKLAPASSDFERGLNESGRLQARELGAQLKHQLAIDLVLSSAARRARETTELVLAAAELSPEIVTSSRCTKRRCRS